MVDSITSQPPTTTLNSRLDSAQKFQVFPASLSLCFNARSQKRRIYEPDILGVILLLGFTAPDSPPSPH